MAGSGFTLDPDQQQTMSLEVEVSADTLRLVNVATPISVAIAHLASLLKAIFFSPPIQLAPAT